MSGGQFILLHAKTASTIWLRIEFVMGNGYFTVIHCFILPFIYGSVKFHYLFLLLNLDFMGVCNKKSIDLPFSGIMSIAKPTLNQGDNAHGHYTVFTSLNSIPT